MSGARRAALSSWLLLLAAAAGAHDQVPGEAQRQPVLLAGGDLYTVSGPMLAATDLLFEGGKITRIAKGIRPPAGTEVLDISGQRVYPGLIAPQTTLGLIEVGAVRATNDRDEVGSITPEVAAHVAFNPDSELIPTVRSHGIAVAQIVPTGTLVPGRSMLVRLDGWTKEDAAIRLVDGLQLSWPGAELPSGGDPEARKKRKAAQETERRELRAAFDEARSYFLARQTDPDLEVDLRWEAMAPLFAGELPVYIAANDRREIVEAVEFSRALGLRMVLVGGAEAYAVTELLLAEKIPVIVGSTLSLPLRPDDDYDMAYKLPALLHQAGVTFCLAHPTSGAWDVRNLPFQAGQAVAFGLPREVALRALTLSTAEILGLASELGSLEPGKQATLFVSDGDVMDTLGQQVRHLFIDGRKVDLDDRHKMLRRKYEQKRAR